MKSLMAVLALALAVAVAMALIMGSFSLDVGQSRPQRVEVVDYTPQVMAQLRPLLDQAVQGAQQSSRQVGIMFYSLLGAVVALSGLAGVIYVYRIRLEQGRPERWEDRARPEVHEVHWIHSGGDLLHVPRRQGESVYAYRQRVLRMLEGMTNDTPLIGAGPEGSVGGDLG